MFFTILISLLGWKHSQLDVKCAYLYAKLNDEIYMFQPKGFLDLKYPNYVCKLTKAIYGLHQSGREWFFEIHSILEELNFKKISWCNCVYSFKSKVLLLLYVDDIVIFGKTDEEVKNVIEKLSSKFDIKILGKTRKLLGVQFEERNGKLFIHQEEYISKVCETFRKFKFPYSSLPIAKGFLLTKMDSPNTDEERKEMSKFPYRSVIGCLAYIAGRTRPDISYAVNILSQFQENPGIKHWSCLLKLLGYLESTKSIGLDLSKINNLNISCYSDSDFAANRDDRISMGGIILFIDKVPVLWKTFKHKSVSLSTMEAEYVTMTDASKEILWFSRIMDECKELSLFRVNSSVRELLCDNLAAIDFSKSPIENSRTKHIDVKFHFLRNLVYDEVFKVKHVSTKINLADLFTKPPTKISLKNFTETVFVNV